jgi:hypothetical protein
MFVGNAAQPAGQRLHAPRPSMPEPHRRGYVASQRHHLPAAQSMPPGAVAFRLRPAALAAMQAADALAADRRLAAGPVIVPAARLAAWRTGKRTATPVAGRQQSTGHEVGVLGMSFCPSGASHGGEVEPARGDGEVGEEGLHEPKYNLFGSICKLFSAPLLPLRRESGGEGWGEVGGRPISISSERIASHLSASLRSAPLPRFRGGEGAG